MYIISVNRIRNKKRQYKPLQFCSCRPTKGGNSPISAPVFRVLQKTASHMFHICIVSLLNPSFIRFLTLSKSVRFLPEYLEAEGRFNGGISVVYLSGYWRVVSLGNSILLLCTLRFTFSSYALLSVSFQI